MKTTIGIIICLIVFAGMLYMHHKAGYDEGFKKGYSLGNDRYCAVKEAYIQGNSDGQDMTVCMMGEALLKQEQNRSKILSKCFISPPDFENYGVAILDD